VCFWGAIGVVVGLHGEGFAAVGTGDFMGHLRAPSKGIIWVLLPAAVGSRRWFVL
jgi:hypothetical protein